jgi:hypothetical protein
MIVDLHAHYPMHLLDKKRASESAVEPLKVKEDFARTLSTCFKSS